MATGITKAVIKPVPNEESFDQGVKIFVRIGRYLTPYDLLRLSCVCSRFNAILHSERYSVKMLWKHSREKFTPFESINCPEDMDQRDFTKLLCIVNGCQNCLDKKARVCIYWIPRIRVCEVCLLMRVINKKELIKDWKVPQEIINIIPQVFHEDPWEENQKRYWIANVYETQREYFRLKTNEEKQAFLKERKSKLDEMMLFSRKYHYQVMNIINKVGNKVSFQMESNAADTSVKSAIKLEEGPKPGPAGERSKKRNTSYSDMTAQEKENYNTFEHRKQILLFLQRHFLQRKTYNFPLFLEITDPIFEFLNQCPTFINPPVYKEGGLNTYSLSFVATKVIPKIIEEAQLLQMRTAVRDRPGHIATLKGYISHGLNEYDCLLCNLCDERQALLYNDIKSHMSVGHGIQHEDIEDFVRVDTDKLPNLFVEAFLYII